MGAKFDNDMSTFFFEENPDQFFSLSELLGCIHFYSSPHFIWSNCWLDWKSLFVNLHNDFFERKIWQPHENFFRTQTRSKIPLFQDLLGCIHSYGCPHFIWTTSWLDWKTLNLHNFWAQNLTTTWVLFFVQNPDKKLLLFQNLLGCTLSYCSPHFIGRGPWLDWKNFFYEPSIPGLLKAQNLTTTWILFFVEDPDQLFFVFQSY